MFGFIDPNTITSIVVNSWAKVETFSSMWCPSATVGWFLVNEDFGSRWCQGSFVVVVSAVYLGIGGEAWVDVGLSHQV